MHVYGDSKFPRTNRLCKTEARLAIVRELRKYAVNRLHSWHDGRMYTVYRERSASFTQRETITMEAKTEKDWLPSFRQAKITVTINIFVVILVNYSAFINSLYPVSCSNAKGQSVQLQSYFPASVKLLRIL